MKNIEGEKSDDVLLKQVSTGLYLVKDGRGATTTSDKNQASSVTLKIVP